MEAVRSAFLGLTSTAHTVQHKTAAQPGPTPLSSLWFLCDRNTPKAHVMDKATRASMGSGNHSTQGAIAPVLGVQPVSEAVTNSESAGGGLKEEDVHMFQLWNVPIPNKGYHVAEEAYWDQRVEQQLKNAQDGGSAQRDQALKKRKIDDVLLPRDSLGMHCGGREVGSSLNSALHHEQLSAKAPVSLSLPSSPVTKKNWVNNTASCSLQTTPQLMQPHKPDEECVQAAANVYMQKAHEKAAESKLLLRASMKLE